ncbi:MarR family winged helix-turn-helix transcriptional regulator [Microbacterium sp. GXF6406]
MERRIGDIEYEQMMLSRYTIAHHRSARGMDRSVYLLLSGISIHGPMSISELSEMLRLDASTLQRQTGAAMRAGFLERKPDPEGGLARKFVLTPEGEQRLVAVRDRSVDALGKILGDWSDDDVDRFAELLHRFNASIEDYRADPRD